MFQIGCVHNGPERTTFLNTNLPLATQVCQKTVKSAKCTVSTNFCGPENCVKVTTVVKDYLYSSVEEAATGKPLVSDSVAIPDVFRHNEDPPCEEKKTMKKDDEKTVAKCASSAKSDDKSKETIGWFECVCDKKKIQEFFCHRCICDKKKMIEKRKDSENESSSLDECSTSKNSESETSSSTDECQEPSTSKKIDRSKNKRC